MGLKPEFAFPGEEQPTGEGIFDNRNRELGVPNIQFVVGNGKKLP
jgi:hypothetical protein